MTKKKIFNQILVEIVFKILGSKPSIKWKGTLSSI